MGRNGKIAKRWRYGEGIVRMREMGEKRRDKHRKRWKEGRRWKEKEGYKEMRENE